MDTLQNLLYGFSVFLTPTNLAYCFFGVLVGTAVGVLPGLGPSATIALLLPATYHASPTASIIMLSGIFYGAMYGGSTTSILVNIPGEAAAMVTCFDGYQMARLGRAGPALGIAAFGSAIAGTFGVICLMLFAPALANFGLRFGPPEYFSLAVMSMTLVTYVTKGSIMKGLMMACVGIILSTVGMDPLTSRLRLTFGISLLSDGFDLVFAAMGLFGISEVLSNLDHPETRETFDTRITQLFPNLQDWKDSAMPIARGTVLGFFLGILPGFGTTITTFITYSLEKKISKHPEKFGTCVIAGVAAPESANNAAATGTFVPLFALGIPANPSSAILLAALMILGLQPGPTLIESKPDLFWGLIASMYAGNVMLLLLNLPLIGLWVKVLKIPYSILFVLILLCCQIGAYSTNNSVKNLFLVNLFGLIGYLLRRYNFSAPPMILALVLGPMLEKALRRSLMLSDGDPTIFFSRPISAIFLSIAILFLLTPLFTRDRIGKKAIEMG